MFLLDHLEQRRAQRPFKPARDDRQRRLFIVEMGYQLARKMCRRLRMTLHQFLSHREQPLGAPPRRRDKAVCPKVRLLASTLELLNLNRQGAQTFN